MLALGNNVEQAKTQTSGVGWIGGQDLDDATSSEIIIQVHEKS